MPRQTPVENVLRQRIVTGFYPPGSRLPLRTRIEEEFSAATHTVQRAIDHLSKQGFVVPRGRLGTFVAEYPPHLYHYALVFNSGPEDASRWGHFYEAFVREARSWEPLGPRRFAFHTFVSGHQDEESFQTLYRDVSAGRAAGVVLMIPSLYENSSLLEEAERTRTPMVGISDPKHVRRGFPCVFPVHDHMIERSLDYLQRAGRKQVALIAGSTSLQFMEWFTGQCKRRGMVSRDYWQHGISPRFPYEAARLASLLARCQDRPDAVVIADDNLVEPATQGLREAGVTSDPTGDVTIVGHANFPYLTPSVLPIARVGFDIGTVLGQCVTFIDRSRRGLPVAIENPIEPIFETELPAKRQEPELLPWRTPMTKV